MMDRKYVWICSCVLVPLLVLIAGGIESNLTDHAVAATEPGTPGGNVSIKVDWQLRPPLAREYSLLALNAETLIAYGTFSDLSSADAEPQSVFYFISSDGAITRELVFDFQLSFQLLKLTESSLLLSSKSDGLLKLDLDSLVAESILDSEYTLASNIAMIDEDTVAFVVRMQSDGQYVAYDYDFYSCDLASYECIEHDIWASELPIRQIDLQAGEPADWPVMGAFYRLVSMGNAHCAVSMIGTILLLDNNFAPTLKVAGASAATPLLLSEDDSLIVMDGVDQFWKLTYDAEVNQIFDLTNLGAFPVEAARYILVGEYMVVCWTPRKLSQSSEPVNLDYDKFETQIRVIDAAGNLIGETVIPELECFGTPLAIGETSFLIESDGTITKLDLI